ncbi:MAG: hypothetical protein RR393_08215 [Bacteroidales bacterium]
MEEINRFWDLVDAHTSKETIHFLGQVKSVDESERSCVVSTGDNIEYEDVRLYSIIQAGLKGFCFIPKKDSLVIVSRIGYSNELFVSLFSEVDKILGTIGEKLEILIDVKGVQYTNDKVKCTLTDTKIECVNDLLKLVVENNKLSIEGANEISLNGMQNGGLVKIKELEKNLNALKNYVEAINTALPTAFTAVGAAMGAVGASGAASYQGGMAGKVIVLQGMENEKVKH